MPYNDGEIPLTISGKDQTHPIIGSRQNIIGSGKDMMALTWPYGGHMARRSSIFKGPKRAYLSDMCRHSRGATCH